MTFTTEGKLKDNQTMTIYLYVDWNRLYNIDQTNDVIR